MSIEIKSEHIVGMLVGMLLLLTFCGWSFYMFHSGMEQAPIRERIVNNTITEVVPVEVSVDTKSADFIRINGKLVKEAK